MHGDLNLQDINDKPFGYGRIGPTLCAAEKEGNKSSSKTPSESNENTIGECFSRILGLQSHPRFHNEVTYFLSIFSY